MKFLITGTAGFIGFHLAKRLLADGHTVIGVDGLTLYYDIGLKKRRHAMLEKNPGFTPIVGMIEDTSVVDVAGWLGEPDVIIHLAAQAGVRYGMEQPRTYVDANLIGSWNVLELAKALKPKHLLLASTSAVYGANQSIPFSESDQADEPISLYAATKKAMEAMAHAYSHLYQLPLTVLRFFTVYGPWGRPDMAPTRFAEAIMAGRPIEVYGMGQMKRDFTYVDDVIETIARLVNVPPKEGAHLIAPKVHDSLSPVAPFRVVNIGRGQPIGLLQFVSTLERCLGKKAERVMLPMQPGDMTVTFADTSLAEALTGYAPSTPLDTGIARFVEWYRSWAAEKTAFPVESAAG
jgi:UDP-glucuronate 4-epimerase